jgi:hypothetical protein
MGEAVRSQAGSPLDLDAGLRARLGLGPAETVQLLQAGPGLLLLGRSGGAGGFAVPWDRDLVLYADVRALALADLLRLLHESRKSGYLCFTHRDHVKSVYLHQGEVVFASSNQRVDRLGECLLRAGAINLEQLREAERRFEGEGRFGKVLVERGFLTPRELWNGVKYQVEEIVRSLFAYTAGTLHFWDGEVQPDNVVRLSLPTERLVREGLQRRDELIRFLAVLEDPRVRLVPVPAAGARLGGTERALFEALATHTGFAELCRHVGLDPLTAARTLQLLRLVGAVQLSRGRERDGCVGEEALRAAEEDAVRECVDAHLALLAELSAPIVALDGARDFAQRFSRVLEEVRERHPQLLRGVSLGPHGELAPRLVLERALGLPGPRLPAVGAALGELVAYLEFELRHHPRLPDPEVFLGGVEKLRARTR